MKSHLIVGRHKVSGLSLVELMIAMVLGLLITAAVVQLFLTNRQTYNVQQGVASIQEQGRFAVDFLAQEMMTAGYGNDGKAFAIASDIGGGRSSDGTLSDSVRALFKYDGATELADSGFDLKDCSGGTLNVASDDDFSPVSTPWKEYGVARDGNGNGVLMCRDSDGSSNPLIDNVEAFQVLYGVTNDPDSSYATHYQTASQIAAGGAQPKIVSVRFGVLLASSDVAVSERDAAIVPERLLNQALVNGDSTGEVDFNDGRLRRVFVSTVALRNTGY